ncbi:hypothetical protein MF265_21680 [Serratia marcescens]|uniref:fimbrial protein n=1 Tax=Serratia marcescens TaxID=615 RepID=UPI001EF03315|nr:hypothetical protein [Serratia marcescens]ULH10505.1 hypothetical protein MF265_21680 [Serratia marcescens]
MKTLFKITAVAALMTAGMSSAFAAGTDAHVTITGNVVPVTCELGPGANAPSIISLGNAAPADFAAGTGAYLNLYTVDKTKKSFSVTVGNCTGVTPADGGQLSLKIDAGGKTLNSAGTVFGGGPGQVSNAGATLLKDGTTTLLKDGDEVLVKAFTTSDLDLAGVSTSVKFDTMMASSIAKPTVGGIDAPITFTVAYQ